MISLACVRYCPLTARIIYPGLKDFPTQKVRHLPSIPAKTLKDFRAKLVDGLDPDKPVEEPIP